MDKITTVTAKIGVGGREEGRREASPYVGELIRCEAPLELVALDRGLNGVRRFDCVFVSAGRVRRRDGRPSNWVIDAEALRASESKFQGVAVFVDHPGMFEGRKVRDLAGVTEGDAHFWDGRIEGTIRLYADGPTGWVVTFLDQILADKAAGRETPDVGLSAVFWHHSEMVDDDRITTEFVHVESVDIVFGPGARGAVRAALQAVAQESHSPGKSGANAPKGGEMSEKKDLNAQPEGGGVGAPPVAVVATPPAAPAALSSTPSAPSFEGWTPDQIMSLQHSQQQAQRLLVTQCQTFLDAKLQMLSGVLPQASRDHLSKQFSGRIFGPEELESAVEAQLDLVAQLAPNQVVRGMGITEGMMLSDVDQVQLAYEKLMGLEVKEPVYPLTGIKELYILLTGDRQMRGVFNPEYAQLQSTTMAVMAEVTRNVLNKVLMDQWIKLGEAGYNWWEKICHIEDFQTLQQVSWVSVNGFTDLSTVAEGGAYTEKTWDDARETADWTKKGNYVGLTLEMIDTDDVGAWRAVPRALATAGIRTLSAAVAALFTANSGVGPQLVDTYYFFDATNHTNLITHFLDADNWDIAVQTMFKQAEAGSSKRLGIRPKYLLVPVEQEKKGRQVLGSGVEPVSGVFYENVRQTAMDNCITVPEWTDADNWACIADPVICPTVGAGFRWGRVPELFTVTDPRMGLMFTNDTLPIKVRYVYAVGVINYRGAVKSNC